MVASQSIPNKELGCPVCGKGKLKAQVRTEHFEYGEGGDKVPVQAENVPVEICTHCHEAFSGPEAVRIRHHAVCRALGLLTPDEIRALRERLGLNQAELAELTGIGKATISRWENGRLLQNKALDRYLRLLAANPENVRLLGELPPSQAAAPRHVPGGTYGHGESAAAFRRLGGADLERYSRNRDRWLDWLNFAERN